MDDRAGEDLVTSEGVNEGSAESATESAANPRPPGIPQAVFSDELTRGGRPQDAERQSVEDERRRGARAVTATPWSHRDPNTPSLEQSVEEQNAGR